MPGSWRPGCSAEESRCKKAEMPHARPPIHSRIVSGWQLGFTFRIQVAAHGDWMPHTTGPRTRKPGSTSSIIAEIALAAATDCAGLKKIIRPLQSSIISRASTPRPRSAPCRSRAAPPRKRPAAPIRNLRPQSVSRVLKRFHHDPCRHRLPGLRIAGGEFVPPLDRHRKCPPCLLAHRECRAFPNQSRRSARDQRHEAR